MNHPATAEEVAEILRAAQAPMHITGGDTRRIGAVPEDKLHTGGLTGIRLYEPGALTLVAGAGTPLVEIEATLAEAGQRLAFEPPDYRALLGRGGKSTIGGIVAANASGPRRIQVGACRDFMLGLQCVDGAGNIIRNGGRVMKNVTGYDLVRLLTGSRGQLGVLTEVALKTLPAPETTATLRLTDLDDQTAIKALSAALGSPFEVTGAAHLPGRGTYLRLEGFAASVKYRAGKLQDLLAAHGPAENADNAIWQDIRDCTAFAGQSGDVWRVSTKPGEGPDIAARARSEAHFYDWGGGLVWLRLPAGTDLRARLGEFTGHATCLRGAGAGAPPESPQITALTEALKTRFDPKGLLSPHAERNP